MYLGHRDNNNDRSQSLYDHCHNVGNIAGINGSSMQIESLMKLAGLLHDLGKATDAEIAYFYGEQSNKPNHSSAGAQYIYDNYFKKSGIQMLTAQLLSSIICSHHSGLLDEVDLEYNDKFTERMTKAIKDKDTVYENYMKEVCTDQEIDTLFKQALKEVTNIFNNFKMGISEKDNACFQFGLFVRYCFSLLIDADYYDTACFFDNKELQYQKTDHQALFSIWKDTLEQYIKSNFKETDNMQEINTYRNEISNSCLKAASKPPGIYRLYVPTGGGKTISSLRFALSHAIHNTQLNRIFYVAPYLSILRQNGKEIYDILNESKDTLNILEHYSSIIDDDFNEEEIKEIRHLYMERWDAPLIITSLVQFLNTLFSDSKSSIRRMQGLSNSIIILDEIQTLPAKVTYMFNQAMNFLSYVCNCTIVLCTATQPTLENLDYRIRIDGDIVADYQTKFHQFKRVDVHDCIRSGGYELQELAEFIQEKIVNHSSALIIMNTKKATVEMYKELNKWNEILDESDKYTVFCLSNNECLKHRTEILKDIEHILRKEKVICVSTSLIEAGVDISFELCFRDCTGLDSIAQAAGRCNRHKELETGEVYIVNYANENIQKLENVVKGQQKTIELLHEFKRNPENYDNDILSPKMMNAYYKRYYNEIESSLAYPVKPSGNLFKYLSYHGRNRVHLPLTQAFATAGSLFKVIDEDTIDVIVPYGESEDLISILESKEVRIEDIQRLLKKLQPYTISVYRNAIDKIPCEYLKSYGIFILKGGYNDEIGLTEYEFSAEFI